MIYVYKDRIVNIEWTVLKGTSNVKENFDRALMKMFLIGPHEKYVLNANAVDGVVSAEVPQGLPEGVYSVEIIYIKNWLGVDRAPDRPRRFPVDCRGNDRCIMRTRKDNLFGITEYESEATNVGEGEVVVRVKTSTASYGYDGLSAYEIAVMRGDFEGTEGEWLEWTHERIVTDVRDLLDKMKSRDTRFVVRTKEQRDSLKDLREGDEVYVIDDGMSYVLRMEGGQRVWHAQDYGSVTAKYMLSMIADLPNFVADRAVADEFGKRIVDEYLTRDAVRRYMNEVFKDLFIENPPTIMDGMITVDMLSDAVKQLIGFGPIMNFPDDEFLTTKNGRITLKDRNYDPNNYSGMGRKVLRKNMVNGVNVLTQRMMSCPNTVYVITYDFDLKGEEITVPEGCVLEFEGGSLRNGTIVGDGTSFVGKIKFINIVFLGIFNQKVIKTKWFTYDSGNDQTLFDTIEVICNNRIINEVYFEKRTYQLNISDKTEEDKFKDYGMVVPSNTILNLAGIINLNSNSLHSFGALLLINVDNVEIKGSCTITGDRDSHIYDSETSEFGVGIKVFGCTNVLIEGVTLNKWTGDGIAVSNRNRDLFSDSVVINNVVTKDCGRCGISVSNANNVTISNSKFINIGKGLHAYSVYSGIDIEPDTGNDGSGNNIKVINCIAENCQFAYKVDSSHVSFTKNIRFINCIADTKSAISNVYDVIFDNCKLPTLLNLNGGTAQFNNCNIGLINITKTGNYTLNGCIIDDSFTTENAMVVNENALICSTIEDDFSLFITNCIIKMNTIKLLTQKYKANKVNNYGGSILFNSNYIKYDELFLGYGNYNNNIFEGNTFRISNITESPTILQKNVINIRDKNNEIVFFKNSKETNTLQFLIVSNIFYTLNNSRVRIANTFNKKAIIKFIDNTLGITTNESYYNIKAELLKGFADDSIISSNITIDNGELTSKIIII